MTTWVRARQATVTSRGRKWSQRRVTLPHPPLYKSGEIPCPSTLARKWRKPEVMLPIPRSGTICFRDSPGALVRFSFQDGESPRCCPVLWLAQPPAPALPRRLLGGLRDRCIAAMLATRKTEVSGHAPQPRGRGPAGFQPAAARWSALTSKKWSLRLDSHQHLTAYETAALLFMLRSGDPPTGLAPVSHRYQRCASLSTLWRS